MSFSKKPKLSQDAAAGYQYFNGLAENAESFRTDLGLEHQPLQSDTGESVDTYDGIPGKHEHPLIPRGVAYVQQVTSLSGPGVSSYSAQIYSSSGCLQSLSIIDVGVYFMPITGFTKVWGKATPWHAGLGSILADPPVGALIAEDARVQSATPTGSGATGLIIKTFKLQTVGGNDILAPWHTGFYVVAFGRRVEVAQPARTAPLRVGNFGRQRPLWKRFSRRR